MSTRRRIRLLAFGFMMTGFLVFQNRTVDAAYFNCIGSLMIADYFGSEVECGGGWPDAMCEAACAYCFNTGCSGVLECVAGDHIASHCTNGG